MKDFSQITSTRLHTLPEDRSITCIEVRFSGETQVERHVWSDLSVGATSTFEQDLQTGGMP
jgi:hypothetical protein